MASPCQTVSLLWKLALSIVLVCGLFFPSLGYAQSSGVDADLIQLTKERERLSAKYEEYRKNIELLAGDDPNPAQSSNPAVRKLAVAMVETKSRIITIIEKEVTLLQDQIVEAESIATEVGPLTEQDAETRPLRTTVPDYSMEQEEENVERLLSILAQQYAELEEDLSTLSDREELVTEKAVQQDAAALAHIPFSPDKVRLSGAEGSAALARVSQRLSNEKIPQSRHNIARICAIKTRQNGTLVSSVNRSLKPVGKNNYVAKVRLQPGDTSIQIGGDRWEVRLPKDINSMNYLITLYIPPSGKPEFHIFSIPDLLAQDSPYIPPWLPPEFALSPSAG